MLRLATSLGRAAVVGASTILVIGSAVLTVMAVRSLLRRQAEGEWERQWQGYAVRSGHGK